MALTDKQQRFCDEYLIDLNATQAAIRAGYSKRTAAEIGRQNLIKLDIQNFIAEAQKTRQSRTEVTADMVITELAKIGFSNIQDFVNGGNIILEIKALEAEKTAAVAGIKTTTNEVTSKSGNNYSTTFTELKFHDKVSALEKLGRHLGLFEKDNRQKTMNIKVTRS